MKRSFVIAAVCLTAAGAIALYLLTGRSAIVPKEVKPEVQLVASVNGRAITA
jgi:hypothetical protein